MFIDRRFGRPSLTILRPYDNKRPTLNIEAHDTSSRQKKPTIHIYKWQPDHRTFPQPSLSVVHELRPDNSWNGQSHGSPSLQVASSPYGLSTSDSARRINTSPVDLESSSSSQAYVPRYAESHAQGFASFSHRNVDERRQISMSSGYVSGDGEGHAKGTSASGYRGGSSVAQVNVQASGNGQAQGIASFEVGSFVSPEGGRAQSQAVPLRHVGGEAVSRPEQPDSDIISDLVQAVGELLDVV